MNVELLVGSEATRFALCLIGDWVSSPGNLLSDKMHASTDVGRIKRGKVDFTLQVPNADGNGRTC